MNEQKKELMLKAAVQFKGVWPDGYEALVVSTETNDCWGAGTYQDFTDGEARFNRVMGDADTWLWVCTKQEFEAFIDSLFEGAPEDAEFYLTPSARTYPAWIKGLNNGECKYKVIISTNLQEYTDKDWRSFNSDMVLRSGSLIPRPRKKPSFIGDAIRRSIDQAYNEAIKKAPNTPTMNDDVTDTNVGEWAPEVGQEFEWMLEGVSDEWHESYFVGYDKEGDMVIQRDTEGLDGLNTTKASHNYKFRPLKTEAEKEWEELYIAAKRLIEMEGVTVGLDESDTSMAINILIDAGWRPSKD